MSVVSLDAFRPHATGKAQCLDCHHEWVAVAPIGEVWLECPACTLLRGRYVFPFVRDGEEWACNCGNDLFHIKREGAYCPNCGVWQHWGCA